MKHYLFKINLFAFFVSELYSYQGVVYGSM